MNQTAFQEWIRSEDPDDCSVQQVMSDPQAFTRHGFHTINGERFWFDSTNPLGVRVNTAHNAYPVDSPGNPLE
jgi:hypothetical protein